MMLRIPGGIRLELIALPEAAPTAPSADGGSLLDPARWKRLLKVNP